MRSIDRGEGGGGEKGRGNAFRPFLKADIYVRVKPSGLCISRGKKKGKRRGIRQIRLRAYGPP